MRYLKRFAELVGTPAEGVVEHIVSVFGNVDDGGDVVHPGAFLKTIRENGPEGTDRIRATWQHDFWEPIGRPLAMAEVSRADLPETILQRVPDAQGGLRIVTKLSMTRRGQDAYTLLQDNVLREWSIGYYPVKWDIDERGDRPIRNLREIKMLEYALVTLAMNPGAMTTDMKGKAADIELGDSQIRMRLADCHCAAGPVITLDEPGVTAVLCEDGSEIAAILFDRAGWGLAAAQEWMDRHVAELTVPKTLYRAGLLSLSNDGPMQLKFVGSPRNPFGTHSSYKFKGGKDGYKAAWRCHFSQVGNGSLDPDAVGPIRGTVRRVAMIAAAMKPPCKLVGTDDIGPREGPKSPLKCSYPEKPSDYGLTSWREAETDEDKEGVKLSCWDLNVIKRAALAEIKRRAQDREEEEGEESARSTHDLNRLARLALADELRSEAGLRAVEPFLALIDELKEGRMLSARNITIVEDAIREMQEAIAALEALLEAAKPPEERALTAARAILRRRLDLQLMKLQST